MTKVITVGNVVVDFVARPDKELPKWGRLCAMETPIEPNIGGNGAIFATYLAKLIKDCSLIGRVGDDLLGNWILDNLKANKVDTTHVKKGKPKTGATVALVDQNGRRAFLHYIGANEDLRPQSVPSDLLGARWLHLGSIFLLPKLPPRSCANLLKKAKDAGMFTSIDIAWDPNGGWDLDRIPKYSDVFFFNKEEGEALTGTDAPLEMVDIISAAGPAITVLKMGEAGCCVKMKTGESFFAPSFDVKVLDSTGAGDAFNAGFVLGLLNALDRFESSPGKGKKSTKKGKKGSSKKGGKGKASGMDLLDIVDGTELKKVALLANALGGISVTRIGGASNPPTQRQLLSFVKSQRKRMVLE